VRLQTPPPPTGGNQHHHQQHQQQHQQRRRPQVRALTDADVKGKEAGEEEEEMAALVHEVVLPLPGPCVILPANAIGEVRVVMCNNV
jgi:hypothetical protein